MNSVTKERKKSYENSNFFYICGGHVEDKYAKDKKYCKVRDRSRYVVECGGTDLKCSIHHNFSQEI